MTLAGAGMIFYLTPARFRFGVKRLGGAIVQFVAGNGVAQDRYRKAIRDDDAVTANKHYNRSMLAGAALGLALRRGKMTRGVAAAAGAAGGYAAQAATRRISAGTKDQYGERSPNGKRLDALPAVAIGAGAALAGRRRLARKAAAVGMDARSVAREVRKAAPGIAVEVAKSAIGLESRGKQVTFAAQKIAKLLRSKRVVAGGALAGGIAAADAITSAAMPEKGETRGEAAVHGLKKGALYGGALAVAEPLLRGAIVKAARKVKFSAREREVRLNGTAPRR